MDYSCAWDFAFPERWTTPARRISRFPSGGTFSHVRLRNSRAIELSHAWNFAFPERWNLPAREILQFLSDRSLHHVRLRSEERRVGKACRRQGPQAHASVSIS